MKRNSVLTSIALSVTLSAFLTGCGSNAANSGNDTGNPDNASAVTLNGKAVDGYLQYATVCLDLSKDGYCQATEPSTQTDENGAFTLKLSETAQQDPNFDTAMLLVYGGKDVDTGDDFTGKLLAPKEGESIVMSPVTTLVAKELQKQLKADKKLTKEEIKSKIKAAKERVAKALDIDPEEIDHDPIAEQAKGNDKLIKKALQLQKAVEALVAAEPDEAKRNERAEKIYEALADSLDDVDPQNRGIGQLLDKTFEKAERDEQVKALLGGDRGLEVGAVAKKMAQTIEKRFDDADEQVKREKDFLKKIGVVTREDLKKIKVSIEDGKDADTIAGAISVDDQLFKQGADWSDKFLAHDLDLIDIDVSPELINKIKALFPEGTKIAPGILFRNAEKLKESNDAQLQAVYEKIQSFLNKQKNEEEEHKAQIEQKIIPIKAPMTLYMPHGDGYGEVTFDADNRLSFTKYKLQQDGTFTSENNDEEEDGEYVLNNGHWVADPDQEEPLTYNEDGTVFLTYSNEKGTLYEGKPIAGETIHIPQMRDIEIPMPAGAQMYFIKVEKTADTYRVDEKVRDYSKETPVEISSFDDFIQKQCGTSWFMGNENGGLAFAGTEDATGVYKCDTAATEGQLVHVYKDDNREVHTGKIAGTWKIKNVDGNAIMIVKPYKTDFIKDDEGGIEYPIFALKDGELWRGNMEPEGTRRMMPAYNKAALEAVTTQIQEKWEQIKEKMPLDKMFERPSAK